MESRLDTVRPFCVGRGGVRRETRNAPLWDLVTDRSGMSGDLDHLEGPAHEGGTLQLSV